ncbi:transmembrane protein 243 [Prionailurus iriomotensis]
MEDFTTRTYGTSGLDNRPLFGETSAKDRIINLVVDLLVSTRRPRTEI